MIVYLELRHAVRLATHLLGDPLPVRDLGLLDSAIARPRASFGAVDLYPDLWHKAAALLISVVVNHPLVDGNKRLGWMCAAAMLELNDVDIAAASNDDVYDLVIDVATGLDEVSQVARRLHGLMQS